MGRYFGTDGFRGEANVDLTADHAYQVGRFLGWYYGEVKHGGRSRWPTGTTLAARWTMWRGGTGMWATSFHWGCTPSRE